MTYKFSDIIDTEAVQSLMDKLWQASGIPTGIIDLDGKILIATGWQAICTRFHRQHPETDARCRESDAFLTRHLKDLAELPACGFVEYRCGNGMIDIAIPIVIEGRHLANIFLGQFFYEPPQEEFFIAQARRCGFDEKDYLTALRQVPIFSRQKVQDILAFNSSLVDLLSRMGMEKLRQVEAQQALQKSEEKFRALFECANDAAYILDPGGKVVEVNREACEQFGFSREVLLTKTMPELVAPELANKVANRIREIQQKGQRVFETRHLRMDGSIFPAEVSIRSFDYQDKPALLGTFRDISRRKQAEEKLNVSLKEKEVLLREIHHRVKNNLQVISSLLFLQSQRFNDPELSASFLECQNSIFSMALAHEQLYQSKKLAEVKIKPYIAGLVEKLRQAYPFPHKIITWRLEIEELVLDIEKIIPLGLMLTELLSNVHKHAFVDQKRGNVTISLCRLQEETLLSVTDDGVGLPTDFDYHRTKTLGMQLLAALINQLNGALEIDQTKGTRFTIRFA